MTRDAVHQAGVALAVGSGVVLGLTGDYGSGAASPSLVQPPSWAFGIWGPIYVGLLAYAVQQALPSRRESEAQRRTGWWVAAAVLSSGFWVRVFPLEVLPVTEALVLFTLVTAGVAVWRARPAAGALAPSEAWLTRAPLGLFFGWIRVATVVGSTEAVLAEPESRVGGRRAVGRLRARPRGGGGVGGDAGGA